MEKRRNFLMLWFIAGAAAGFFGAARFLPHHPSHTTYHDNIASTSDEDNPFGNWLAAQHAISADDFESARRFASAAGKTEQAAEMQNLLAFLDGERVDDLKRIKASGTARRLITATANARIGKWRAVYADFKNERSTLWAPMKIWAAAALGNQTEALAMVDALSAGSAWKKFTKGAIYAAAKKPMTARKFFADVPSGFLNLGDYNLLMSFYKRNRFFADASELEKKWTASPGGMYLAGTYNNWDWRDYDSYQKMLASSLIQTVAHNFDSTQSDASLLALRTAAQLGASQDQADYYTGGYFFGAGSPNYKKYWTRLKNNPIYDPFVQMKIAEKSGDIKSLTEVVRKNPLFMPAIISLWRRNIQSGRQAETIRMLDRALAQPNVPDAGRAYLLKLTAHTLYIFGEYGAAEECAAEALRLAPMDAGILELTARIWIAENKNLDEAYRYAISLIKAFPGNVGYWDALAMAVRAKEGDAAAREILERVGKVAGENSELFMHLGDLRARAGDQIAAARAYRKAIALSGDGLVVRRDVERKLKKISMK